MNDLNFETRNPCIPDYVINVWDKLSQETRDDYLLEHGLHMLDEFGQVPCPNESHDVFGSVLDPAERTRAGVLGERFFVQRGGGEYEPWAEVDVVVSRHLQQRQDQGLSL